MDDRRQAVALDNYLSTNADTGTYIANLESYLFRLGLPKPGTIKFVAMTVDADGKPQTYTLNGIPFVGLIMNISPTSMNVNMSQLVTRTQTMSGWIEEHWGQELDTVTFQGSSAAFIWNGPEYLQGPIGNTPQQIRDGFNAYMNIPGLPISSPVGPGDHSGLAVRRRRETTSYDELRKIIQLMNSNTAEFDIYGIVKARKYIQLSHDYACYRGYFESIDITENADTPFKFIYTITFKAEKTIYSFLR